MLKPIPAAFDSIQQCAANTGIPKSVIQKAKANGCPAFRSNRITVRPLLKYIFKSSDANKVDQAKAKMAVMESSLMEERFKEESGANRKEHMDAMRSAMTQILSPVRTKLLSMPGMLAARVNPSDPDLARPILESFVDELLKGTQQ